MTLLTRLLREDEGQDLIEYVLLAAGIAVVCIPTVPLLGAALSTRYGAVTTSVDTIGS
jgi:Flp pilus assembly pilin Flp